MRIDAVEIKYRAEELGADLCGIATVDRFADAPPGFHPTDVSPAAKAVIVVASRFPVSTLTASQAAYTMVRHKMVAKMDNITFQLSSELDLAGVSAVPIPASDPYEFWDEDRRHGQGILSLKHAAVRAGLGKMGKNTLLINDLLGNMLWLGAVLVNLELEPDPLAAYDSCIPGCRICLDACPAQALDGVTISQKKCRAVSSMSTPGGGVVLACNKCRKVCPNHKGIRRSC